MLNSFSISVLEINFLKFFLQRFSLFAFLFSKFINLLVNATLPKGLFGGLKESTKHSVLHFYKKNSKELSSYRSLLCSKHSFFFIGSIKFAFSFFSTVLSKHNISQIFFSRNGKSTFYFTKISGVSFNKFFFPLSN